MNLLRDRKKRVNTFRNFSFFFSLCFLFLVFSSFFIIIKYENQTNSLRVNKIPDLIRDNHNFSEKIENTKKNINLTLSLSQLELKVEKINNQFKTNQLQKIKNNQKVIGWLQ
tara:strand:- start:46 stop:381 length:336 start_codon:yes stop_codon:yes gene_type:complete